MKNKEYISDFEELFKLKEFQNDNKKMPFDCTYEQIVKALKNEYTENINEKINRWVDVTHILYFENTKPTKYYLQAKMLYRDGFYEAAIVLSRSICEMICYDLLSKMHHPFGNLELIEKPIFRVLANFLAMPKNISKDLFDNSILDKITQIDDKNFIKSSFVYSKTNNVYQFKIENGKTNSNLEYFFTIFKSIDFNKRDCISIKAQKLIHAVYDIGNTYVHVKRSNNSPNEDAISCLNSIGQVLHDIYGIKGSLENKIIKSGYTDFPDICIGMNFAIDCYITPEDASRGYFNIPNQKQVDLLLTTVGKWNGEWKNSRNENQKGLLSFYKEGEYLKTNLKYTSLDNNEYIEPMDIRLYGNYFQIIGFDISDMKHKKGKHGHFELEFLNENILIGECVDYPGRVLFQRIIDS